MSEKDYGLLLSNGFSAGSEAEAYKTRNLDEAMAHRSMIELEPYRVAFILGFYSSYETHEIPQRFRSIFEDAYKSEPGQRVIAHGYCDPRPELSTPAEEG